MHMCYRCAYSKYVYQFIGTTALTLGSKPLGQSSFSFFKKRTILNHPCSDDVSGIVPVGWLVAEPSKYEAL